MTHLIRLDVIRLCLSVSLLLILPVTSGAQQPPPIAQQMAKTYGLDSFAQVEAIRWTFHGELPGRTLVRSWEWHPKTDTVSYEGQDKEGKPVKVTYKRSELDSQSDAVKKEIDPGFVNDQYWLLLPLHAVWDDFATVTDAGKQKLPLGETSAEKIVVKYPDGGYSPGDTWEFYVGPDKRVQEIGFHRGGAAKPSLVFTTFAEHKKVGPLLISTDHRGTADGKPLRVYLTDVSVQVTGSKDWINAQ